MVEIENAPQGASARIATVGVVDRARSSAIGVKETLFRETALSVDVVDSSFLHDLSAGVVNTGAWEVLVFDPSQLGSDWEMRLSVLQETQPHLALLAYGLDISTAFCDALLDHGVSGVVDKEDALLHLIIAVQAVRAGSLFVSARFRDRRPVARLSLREAEVVQRLAKGERIGEISKTLSIARQTAFAYKQRAMKKLGVSNEIELFQAAVECGLVTGRQKRQQYTETSRGSSRGT